MIALKVKRLNIIIRTQIVVVGLVLTVMLSMGPVWADAKTDLAHGVNAEMSQDYQLAIHYYSKAIASNQLPLDNLAVAFYNRGNVYAKLDRADNAIKDYSSAIAIEPRFAEAYSNRALIFAKRRIYQKAIDDLTKAIELDHADAQAYVNRGNLYESLSDLDHAMEDWKVAYDLGHQPHWLVTKLQEGGAL